jgi:predicted DCC family thiol-disulfide oxidoreductase YuxK
MIRDPMQALERDLQAERASALARITDLFEKALAVWEALEAGQLAPLGTAAAELERRVELRELTAERLWMLIVQRETVGLRDHRELLQRVPLEIRRRIGPRRYVPHPTG